MRCSVQQDPLIHFQLLRPSAKCPTRGTSMSGAFDLYAPEPGLIHPFEKVDVPSGIAHQINPHVDMLALSVIESSAQAHLTRVYPFALQALLIPRSGLAAKKGIRLFFAPGLIDHDYRGEITITVENVTYNDFAWSTGDRLCQLMYVPAYMGGCDVVEALTETERGAGGHGHTGK